MLNNQSQVFLHLRELNVSNSPVRIIAINGPDLNKLKNRNIS